MGVSAASQISQTDSSSGQLAPAYADGAFDLTAAECLQSSASLSSHVTQKASPSDKTIEVSAAQSSIEKGRLGLHAVPLAEWVSDGKNAAKTAKMAEEVVVSASNMHQHIESSVVICSEVASADDKIQDVVANQDQESSSCADCAILNEQI